MSSFTFLRIIATSALFSIFPSWADSIGPTCGSCYGATYTLTNLGLISSTATTETYRIQYDINTAGYTGAATDYIQSVAIKVSSNAVWASLHSAPGGVGIWTVFSNRGLNNSNCSNGGTGYVCAQDGNYAVADGSTYTWVFNIIMARGSLLTGANAASIKANYNPPNGIIVSENITMGQIPEPATVSLLIGGIGFWGYTRFRARKNTPANP